MRTNTPVFTSHEADTAVRQTQVSPPPPPGAAGRQRWCGRDLWGRQAGGPLSAGHVEFTRVITVSFPHGTADLLLLCLRNI